MSDMYTLTERIPMNWSVVYPGGTVKPYFTLERFNKPKLHFVDLFDADGECKGHWARHTMPFETIRPIEQWIDMAGPALRQLDMRDWTQLVFRE